MAAIKYKITDVKGIGPSTAKILAEHGIKTVHNLASASIPRLTAIHGFSEFRAGQVKFNAQLLLKRTDSPAEPVEPPKPKAKAESKKPVSSSLIRKDNTPEKLVKSKKDKTKSKEDEKAKAKSKKKGKKKEKSKDKSTKKDKKKK